jgi:hypothetical protein
MLQTPEEQMAPSLGADSESDGRILDGAALLAASAAAERSGGFQIDLSQRATVLEDMLRHSGKATPSAPPPPPLLLYSGHYRPPVPSVLHGVPHANSKRPRSVRAPIPVVYQILPLLRGSKLTRGWSNPQPSPSLASGSYAWPPRRKEISC